MIPALIAAVVIGLLVLFVALTWGSIVALRRLGLNETPQSLKRDRDR